MQEELNIHINELRNRLEHLRGYLDIDNKRKGISQIEAQMSEPDFWSDINLANKKTSELKDLKSSVRLWSEINVKLEELDELLHASTCNDVALIEEIKNEAAKLDEELNALEFRTLFSGRFDKNNAIVNINAGAGGTESCDWTSMLYRMYTRWAENKGFTAKIIDVLAGEEAGIKNVTFSVKGEYAYGYLRSEKGVHRLVRISPFDANKRRHTSFASVGVIPEVQDDVDIQINIADLRIDTYRSSGAGGQHVNVTDSAVRITHLPTGIVVQCQNERSQYQNKAVAMRILRARLYEKSLEERQQEISAEHAQKKKIEWGSQIRSYVMHPYSLVKDHRTEFEMGNVNAVLNGEVDKFIEQFLKYKASKSDGNII
ncbi:MAG: peptide chain release factor 2 [Candidatus Omnitrophica bacterium]|nr:peptide chain release factor 2 [Candidatus Omnitrophota bacterium]